MEIKSPADLLPLVERIAHRGLTLEELPRVGVLAPGKTLADVKAAMDCSKQNGGAGNFSYGGVIASIARRLFDASVFTETFVEEDD